MNLVALKMPTRHHHGDRRASIMCAIIADIAILTELEPW